MGTIKLQNIVKIKKGKKVLEFSNEFVDGAHRYIQIDDLRHDENVKYTSSKGVEVKKDDVLIAWDGANAGTVRYGLAGLAGSTISCLEIVDNKFETAFIGKCLKSKFRLIRANCTGATIPHVSRDYLLNLSIPVKSLKEQKQIVLTLDTADGLLRKRKEQLKLLDDYLKSVFLEMFGDPVRNEKDIAQKKIGAVGEVVTGNTPSRQKKEYYGDFIEWIKSDNINTPEFVLTKAEEFLSKIGVEVGRVAPKGSVLVTSIAGSPDCIGNCAISDRDVAFNQQINAFVPGKEIKTEFFFAQLYLCKRLVQQASTESMKGMVSKSRFSDIKVLVPKLNEQVEFVRVFNQISGMRKKMRASLDEMDNHFNALMQRALRGELHG